MFDIGFWELAVISVVALVIIGPERLPGAARTAGLWVERGRRMLREVKADIDRELKAHDPAGLEEIKKDLKQAGAELKDTATEISKTAEQDVPAMQETLKKTFQGAAPAADEDGKAASPVRDSAGEADAAAAPDTVDAKQAAKKTQQAANPPTD